MENSRISLGKEKQFKFTFLNWSQRGDKEKKNLYIQSANIRKRMCGCARARVCMFERERERKRERERNVTYRISWTASRKIAFHVVGISVTSKSDSNDIQGITSDILNWCHLVSKREKLRQDWLFPLVVEYSSDAVENLDTDKTFGGSCRDEM